MNDTLEKIYNAIGYIIMGGLLFAYFIFQSSTFEKPILQLIQSYENIIHVLFTTFANVLVVSIGFDSGLDKALSNEKFLLADKNNNDMINDFDNNYERLIDYIEYKTKLSKQSAQKEFLSNIDKKYVEDLNEKELKKYKKIKYNKYTLKGLTRPLYSKPIKNNLYSFDVSYKQNSSKTFSMIKKLLTGFMFGFMTVDIIIKWTNLGDALFATLSLGAIMLSVYSMNYAKPILTLTKEKPKEVENKKLFHSAFMEYIKKGL